MESPPEGAVIGGLYALCIVSLLYSALVWLGPTHAMSAACYAGVAVVVWDGYQRLYQKAMIRIGAGVGQGPRRLPERPCLVMVCQRRRLQGLCSV